MSKIIGKSVINQLTNYLELNNIISVNQYGFRRDKNSSDTLFDLTKFITSNLGSKRKVLITFLDIAKAFNSVDEKNLIAKLNLLE